MTPELEAALQKIDGATRLVIEEELADAGPSVAPADVRFGVGDGLCHVPGAADVRSGVAVDAAVGSLFVPAPLPKDLALQMESQVWLDAEYETFRLAGLDAYGTAQEAYDAAVAKATAAYPTVTPTRLMVGDKAKLKAFNAVHFRGNWNHAMSVLTGSTSALRFAADQPFTIEYWILGTGYCGSPTYENNWSTGPRMWWTSNDFSIQCEGGGRCGSARAFEGGVFHHVAFQWDGSAWSLWVDGVSAELETSWTVPYTPTGGAGRFGMFEGFQSGSDLGPMRISNIVRYTEGFSPPTKFTNDSHTKFATHFAEGTLVRNGIIHDISSNGLDLTFGCDADGWGDLCFEEWLDWLKITAESWAAGVSLEALSGSSNSFLDSISLSGDGDLNLDMTGVTIGLVRAHGDVEISMAGSTIDLLDAHGDVRENGRNAKISMTGSTITTVDLRGGSEGGVGGTLDATLIASTIHANLSGGDGALGGNGSNPQGADGAAGASGEDGVPTPGSDGEDGADGTEESPDGATGGAGGDGGGADGSPGSDGEIGGEGDSASDGESGGDGGAGGTARIVLLGGSICSVNVIGGTGGVGGYGGYSAGGYGGAGGTGGNGAAGTGGDGGAGGDAYLGGEGFGGVGGNGGNAAGGGGGAGGNGGPGGNGGSPGNSGGGGTGGASGSVITYVSSTSALSVDGCEGSVIRGGWGGWSLDPGGTSQGGGGGGGGGGVADNTSNVGAGGQGGLNADGETRAGSGSDGTFTEAFDGSGGSEGEGWGNWISGSYGNSGSEGTPSEAVVVTLDVP